MLPASETPPAAAEAVPEEAGGKLSAVLGLDKRAPGSKGEPISASLDNMSYTRRCAAGGVPGTCLLLSSQWHVLLLSWPLGVPLT